ncbi:hypothetical protein ARMGADRAFT_1013633 [Armillaria gallica]|uniref:Uncharacterized protein n=1 Tax=Armillaria gallica TaxID=47427 RepID=A0A2H3DDG7_ARMGA|nr:hypothetical protein ARMGADRAFT_1013633 [Armillaria gallica]
MPELFPTKDRGAGDVLASVSNRVFRAMASAAQFFVFLSLNISRPRSLLCTQA